MDAYPGINFDGLELVYKQIISEPGTWWQSLWAMNTPCRTTYCFAGHAVVMLSDAKLIWETSGLECGEEMCSDRARTAISCVFPNGEYRPIDLAAQTILGLSGDQADMLFAASNGLADIRRMINDWRSLAGLPEVHE